MRYLERREDAQGRQQIDVRFPTRSLKEDGTFAGYGSVFNVVDSYDTRVAPGAFTESIKSKVPKMLRGHDPDKVIGGYSLAKEDKYGLYLEGAFDLDVQEARETHSLVKKGYLDGLSIGFMTLESEDDHKANIRTITKVDLWEVSIVTFAANPKASVVDVRTEKDEEVARRIAELQQIRAASWVKTRRDFEKFLRDEGGFSHAAAKRFASRGFDAAADPRDEDGSLSELMAAVRRAHQALSQH